MRPTTPLAAIAALLIVTAGLLVATGDRRVRAQSTETTDARTAASADRDLSAHLFQVEIGLSEMRLDGDHVVDLEGGTLNKSGWSAGPWNRAVAPLKSALQNRLEAVDTREFVYPATLLLLPHPAARFALVEGSAVSAHESGLDRFRLGVEDPEHHELLIVDIEPPSSDESRVPKLALTVTSRGFDLRLEGDAFRARGDCPDDGPSVCLSDRSVDVDATVEEARSAYRNGDEQRGRQLLSTAFEAYDFEELKAALSDLKDHRRKQTRYRIDAGDDIPAALVLATILRARSTSVQKRGLFGPTRGSRDLLNEPQFAR